MISYYVAPGLDHSVMIRSHAARPDIIEEIVSSYYGFTVLQMRKTSRKQLFIACRRLCYAMLRKYTNLTVSGIAARFGQDHTTVIHALRTFNDLKSVYEDVRFHYERVNENVRNRLKCE